MRVGIATRLLAQRSVGHGIVRPCRCGRRRRVSRRSGVAGAAAGRRRRRTAAVGCTAGFHRAHRRVTGTPSSPEQHRLSSGYGGFAVSVQAVIRRPRRLRQTADRHWRNGQLDPKPWPDRPGTVCNYVNFVTPERNSQNDGDCTNGDLEDKRSSWQADMGSGRARVHIGGWRASQGKCRAHFRSRESSFGLDPRLGGRDIRFSRIGRPELRARDRRTRPTMGKVGQECEK